MSMNNYDYHFPDGFLSGKPASLVKITNDHKKGTLYIKLNHNKDRVFASSDNVTYTDITFLLTGYSLDSVLKELGFKKEGK